MTIKPIYICDHNACKMCQNEECIHTFREDCAQNPEAVELFKKFMEKFAIVGDATNNVLYFEEKEIDGN